MTIKRDQEPADVAFLDIRMPGMDGLTLAELITGLPEPPRIVFVTAYDAHAVDAFELQAADYLLKPVSADRFAAAVASFGMVLRESPYKGQSTLDAVIEMAEKSKGRDTGGYREEFIRLARKARAIRELQ